MNPEEQFNICDYRKQCPMASVIEDKVNTTGGVTDMLDSILKETGTPAFSRFASCCLAYWSRVRYWDERNRYAVLASKKIIERFPDIASIQVPEYERLNAYGFVSYAHRYLQGTLYKVIMEFLGRYDDRGIPGWLEEQRFVYADDGQDLIPYDQYISSL